MTELSIHIPRELAITADSIIEEQQIPLIAADRIGRGLIHPDRLPPSIPTLTQIYEAVLEHEGKTDPHPQYATDSEFTSHAGDSALHIPVGGISNSQIAAGAAIDWAKISKSGAAAADVGAMPALGTIDQQVSVVKPTVRSTGAALQVGDRWLDTGDRIWWFWNGSYWLSEQIYQLSSYPNGLSVTTLAGGRQPLGYNIFFLSLEMSATFNSGTYDSTNNWQVRLVRDIAGTSAAVVDASLATLQSTLSSAENRGFSTALNLHRDATALNILHFRINWIKNSNPPALSNPGATLTYRLAKP